MKTAEEIAAKLNETGAVIYQGDQEPKLACWVGFEKGFFWFHQGDVPHWGPPDKEIGAYGEDSLLGTEKDPLFYVTNLGNSPEIDEGGSMADVHDMRRSMTRDQAIALLGSTPAKQG